MKVMISAHDAYHLSCLKAVGEEEYLELGPLLFYPSSCVFCAYCDGEHGLCIVQAS
jgi:hypothetical protein